MLCAAMGRGGSLGDFLVMPGTLCMIMQCAFGSEGLWSSTEVRGITRDTPVLRNVLGVLQSF